jgi:omega-amidase
MRIGMCFDAEELRRARRRSAFSRLDVLLFPELLDGGYAALNHGMPPHSFRDRFITFLRASSRDLPCALVAGSCFLKEGTTSPTNTSLAFRRGKLVHRYDKIHLFRPSGDGKFFQRGRLSPRPFHHTTGSGRIRIGVVICYDLRFPELVRALAGRGLDLLLVPARWPSARDDAWQSLLKARAIENQVFVVGCNAPDGEGGYSYAFDPLGRLVYSTRAVQRKPLHTFEFDRTQLATARILHNNLKDAVFLKTSFGKHHGV